MSWSQNELEVIERAGLGRTLTADFRSHYRDAKVTEIYEGTSEIQKLVIGRALLTRE